MGVSEYEVWVYQSMRYEVWVYQSMRSEYEVWVYQSMGYGCIRVWGMGV